LRKDALTVRLSWNLIHLMDMALRSVCALIFKGLDGVTAVPLAKKAARKRAPATA
jgi:hypothetical protein